MKAKAKPTNGTRVRSVVFSMEVTKQVFDILTDYRLRHLDETCSTQDAAKTLLLTALLDWEHLLARLNQVADYCEAEGLDAGHYRAGVLRLKFPRGRLPRRPRR